MNNLRSLVTGGGVVIAVVTCPSWDHVTSVRTFRFTCSATRNVWVPGALPAATDVERLVAHVRCFSSCVDGFRSSARAWHDQEVQEAFRAAVVRLHVTQDTEHEAGARCYRKALEAFCTAAEQRGVTRGPDHDALRWLSAYGRQARVWSVAHPLDLTPEKPGDRTPIAACRD
jgi:hypothetical protein